MKTCYFCGLDEDQYTDEELEWFQIERVDDAGQVEVQDVQAHASCNDFFWSKRCKPLRISIPTGLRPMEEETL